MEFGLQQFRTWFETESAVKTHRLICNDKVYCVSGHSLAEKSRYFERLFFGNFEEARTKTVTIEDVSSEEVMQFFEVFYGRSTISVANLPLMIRLAEMWDVPSLRTKCKELLKSDTWDSTPLEHCIIVLEVALAHGLRKHVGALLAQIGQFPQEELMEQGFFEKIEDLRLVAAVCKVIGQTSVKEDRTHDWQKSDGRYDHCDHSEECPRYAMWCCALCGKNFCGQHISFEDCPKLSRKRIHIDKSILFEPKQKKDCVKSSD